MRNRPLRAWTSRALMLAAGVVGIALGASGARAAGPDVIVGDLPDIMNLGASGNKRVYAFGTTSCNLGDVPLTWIANTNVHPVISQNMYRLVNGRFEQIGQAWLKHGFCALQGTVCSTCTPGGSCSALYPGCSDPYSASLNASQGGLGPKSEVNAATGAFPYPWVNNGESSTEASKRLAVLTTDLTETQAGAGLFFFASMYVQPEDAAANNDNNNQSYRRVTVSAAPNYTAALVDTTQRTKAAIYAWKDHGLGVGQADPGVSITPMDITGDGRFLIGAKATDLGNGQWHYEYAIQNLNSDRSGGSFSIPLPAGAVVTNVGFRDVDYTSGEPQDGTDWTSAVSAGSITWNCTQTHAQNANANALRWDTIYNFRFDCNVPPAGGQATIGLFKPGSPASSTVATIAPSADGQPHPLNDNCANAADISGGATGFSNVGSSTDGPDEPAACTSSGYSQIGSDVWYRYVSNACATGATTIATCGSGFDTKIAVYPGGTCPTTGGTVIVCNDDATVCGSASLQSSLSFTATPNTAYLIRVGGYNALTGSGTITITPPSCGPVAPANDACTNAAWLTHNVATTGSTSLSTNDGSSTCGQTGGSPDVWFRYKPTVNFTNANFNTCGSNFDSVLSIYTGTCGSLTQVACNDDNGSGNNSCGGGTASGVNYTITAGTTYYVRIAGYQSATGSFTVRVIGGNGVPPPEAPANDACSARAGIGLGASAFTTAAATTDGPAHVLCLANGSNQVTNDVWWNFPSTFNGRLKIETCSGSGFDSRIAVYAGNGCTDFESRLIACADDGTCTATRAEVTVQVTAGQNYTIRVGGTSGAAGAGTLTLTSIICPADINNNGQATIDDLFVYLNIYFAQCTGQSGNPCNSMSADFNGVGGVTIDDLFLYINAYFEGC